jgi:hypothetical protein
VLNSFIVSSMNRIYEYIVNISVIYYVVFLKYVNDMMVMF